MAGDLRPISSWQAHLPEGEHFSPDNLICEESLPRLWVKVLSTDPDQRLIYDSSGKWMLRGEFLEESGSVARAMYASGLRAGERVILSGAASTRLVVYYAAALRLGLVVVPMNPGFTESEVFHVVRDVKPSGAIVDSAALAGLLAEIVKQQEFSVPFSGPGAGLPLPHGVFRIFFVDDEVEASGGSEVPMDAAWRDAPALIAYTSGTTGRPKGAILSHGNLLASARSLNIAWRWTESDRLILALPLFHMHGLGVGINGSLCVGSSIILFEKFEADRVLAAIREFSASLFFGVPTMYQRLLEAEKLDEVRSMRLLVSGSAPLPEKVQREIAHRTGAAVLERYGTTESLIDISNPCVGERQAGCVGFPLPGVEVAFSGSKNEIFIGGPTVFSGYLNDSVATAAAFPMGAGWFATGDVGSVDARGYVSIIGRLKDVIITGGYNVYPKEVEDALRSHFAVTDVAVAGVQSETWGEEVVAFVVKSADVTGEALIKHASFRLASYKRPKKVIFVEEFPRNALGKVVPSELRKMATPNLNAP